MTQTTKTLSAMLTATAVLMVAAAPAMASDKRCDGMDKQLEKLSKAVDKACKATKAKQCSKINSPKAKEYKEVASKFVSEWNKVVGNSKLKIGARHFDLGRGGDGTIQSTQRMWVSKGISTGNTVEITVSEKGGKLYTGAHVCVLEPGKKTPVYKKTVKFNADSKSKNNGKERKTIKVTGAKGKIVIFKLAAQKASANKFKYSFTSKSR